MPKLSATQDENDIMAFKMTPMIDVIFQLLIFLMCSLHFRSLDAKLDTVMPANTEMRKPQGNTSASDIKIILIHNAGNPLMPMIKLDGLSVADYDELIKALTDRRSACKELSVVIEPQKEIPVQCVVNTIDACKKAGIVPRLSR